MSRTRRLVALPLALLVYVQLLAPLASHAADDVNVSGGSYSGILRAVDVQSLGKLYQAILLADPTTASTFAKITNAAPASGDNGLVTRQVGMPAPTALVDTTGNPTLTQIAVFPLAFNGSSWDRVRLSTAPPNASDPALLTRQVGLPAAAALADATANPTLTQIAAFGHGFNGTTWDRLRVNNNKFLQVQCAEGCVQAADTLGTTVAFNAAPATAEVAITGQHAVSLTVAAGTLDGTIGIRFSLDGTNYQSDGNDILGRVIDPESWASGSTLIFTNPNALTQRSVIPPPGAIKAQAYLTIWNSGTANVTLRATTAQAGAVLFVSTASGVEPLRAHTSAPASGDPGIPVRVISTPGVAGGTSGTDEFTFTVGATAFTPVGGFHQTTRDTLTNNQAGAWAFNTRRAGFIALETTAGDDPWDDTLNGLQVVLAAIPATGGQKAVAGVATNVNCTNQENLNFTATARQLMVAKAAGERIYICSMIVWPNGDGNITFREGTQTTNPCDTSDAILAGPFYMSSTNGRPWVVPASAIPFLRTETDNEDLCVDTSAAVATTVFFTWARFPAI